MSPDPENEGPPLALDELARTALALSAERELPALIARFTECVRAWAAPSALVAAVRGAEAGAWRVLPALSFGSLPLGIERALQQLVEDLPECLERPSVQQPIESVPGVKVRDNWIVPWWSEGESGLLLLRGVPRPYPQNLGAALALVSAPVWPRILGGPATRVQSLVEQLQQMSGQLQVETARELQRLQATAAASATAATETEPAAAAPEAPPAADPAVVAGLEEELREASEQRQAARDEAAGLRVEVTTLRDELTALRDEAASRAEEHARLREEHTAVSDRLRSVEEQRGSMRLAEARARAAEEALAAAQGALASHAGALRTERASAVDRIEEHRRALEQAEQRAAGAEQALAAERAAGERSEEQRRDVEAAEARARAAAEALGAQAADAQRELAALREQTALLREQLSAAEQGRSAAQQAMTAAQQATTAAESELGRSRDELAAAKAETDAARHELAAAQARIATEQERGRTAGEALGVVRTALVALNRSAFVPSGLRFALEDVSAALQAEPPARPAGSRVVILDRDLGGLESLAAELESTAVDVRIANYPEELALLLRTPAAREVVAAICDVMAFRPDQNIAGLLRSWEKERPGLVFFLSYDADSSVEMERARRVPLSLTAAHLPRPLPARRVAEAIESLARRQARP